MLSTLLTELDHILHDKFSFTEARQKQFAAFFSHYNAGDWIYPGVVKRQLSVSIEDSYRILSALEKAKVLESWYEYCCGHCQRVLGTVQRFNELPESFDCEVCGTHMNTMDNTIKIYKVCQP